MVRGCRRPPAPHRWLVDVVARRGFELGDGAFRLPSTQAELAADAGCSSGTIQARIRLLERQGLVISRRPLTVRLPVGVTPTVSPGAGPPHQPGDPGAPPRPPEPATGGTDQALPHLLAANAALAAAVAAAPTAELIAAQQAVLTAIAHGSRFRDTFVADPRPDLAVPRLPVAEPRLSGGESVSESLLEDRETDSLPGSVSRGSADSQVPSSRIREGPGLAGTDIDELIRPLVTIADRCGLVGLNDRSGIHDALSRYDSAAIRHAVSQVARMAKAGQIRSPLGWLTVAARRGDPDLFSIVEHCTTPPMPAPTRLDELDAATQAAERALATAGPDQLAALDEWIRSAPHHARIRHLIFEPSRAQMLHTARIEAWHVLQEVS